MPKPSVQDVIDDVEFDELLEFQLKAINDIVDKGIEEWTPTLIVARRDGFKKPIVYQPIILPDFGDPDNKHAEMRALGKKLWNDRDANNGTPVAVLLTTEAWMAKLKNEADVPEGGVATLPENQRTECLATFGMTIDGRVSFVSHEIKRDKQKHLKLTMGYYAPYQSRKTKMESPILTSFYLGVAKAAGAIK